MPTKVSSLPIDESILDDDFFKELELRLGISEEEDRSVDFDDAFFAELDELVDADFRNCGTGAVGGKQGFQPGNKCAGSGETTKGKKESGKKEKQSGPKAATASEIDDALDSTASGITLESDQIFHEGKKFPDRYDKKLSMVGDIDGRLYDTEVMVKDSISGSKGIRNAGPHEFFFYDGKTDELVGFARGVTERDGSIRLSMIALKPEHQGNNRGTEIYKMFLDDLGLKIKSDFEQSDSAQAVYRKLIGEGYKPTIDSDTETLVINPKTATTNQLTSKATGQLKETGGFTVHPITGTSPTSGYMVATVPGAEIKVQNLTENKLSGFIQNNADNFRKDSKLHAGGWYNKKDGKIYLDLSTNETDLDSAKGLAKKYKQIAIWDVSNKVEINTEDLWKGDNANEEQERSVEGRTGRTRSTRERVSTQGQASRGQRGLDPIRLQSGRRERPSGDAEGDSRNGREVRIAKGREVGSESQEERNCGTGAVGGKQGFQPGNKCAGSGEKTKGKAEGKENKKGSAPSSDLFPSGSQPFRTAVDDATTASGLDSSSIWDRSKGFRDLPDRSTIEAFAKEQQSKSGKAMTPAGRKAYDALIDDLGTQYQALTDAGLKVYGWEGKGEPYAKVPGGTKVDSNMMRKMVAKDGEFRFFMTDKGFGTGAATKNHPMLKMTKYKTSDGKPLIANDLFRVVHDMVAHVRGGHSFSTKGEFNGMLTHATTLNKKAWPALFSETFAQNSVYEITNKFAPQNAYGSRKGAKLISVELENMMNSTDETERAVSSGDGDEPLGYWHLKQRPWLVDKLSKDEPSEQEKENG